MINIKTNIIRLIIVTKLSIANCPIINLHTLYKFTSNNYTTYSTNYQYSIIIEQISSNFSLLYFYFCSILCIIYIMEAFMKRAQSGSVTLIGEGILPVKVCDIKNGKPKVKQIETDKYFEFILTYSLFHKVYKKYDKLTFKEII